MPFTEANFENAILEIFRDLLGYEYLYGPDVVRDFTEPLCVEILEDALLRINPSLPRAAIDEAIARIRNIESGSLARKNARFTDMLQNGVAVNYFDGSEQRAGLVRLVDYDLPMRNRFTVANQWTVEERSVRRADIVVFVNGLPLVVVELKSPSREATDVSEAYAQLRNYMQEIPSLFVYNAFCVMSDLATTKAGTITAGEDRFMEWKTVDGKLEDARFANFDVLFRGMFEKSRFIELLGGFICCSEKDGQDIKILSAYHQFYAVRKAVDSTLRAAETDGRGGVFWHTQGSGKSLSMVFFAKRLQRAMASPTIVVLTDRNDLDGQLYGQFAQCSDFLRQVPVQASSRAHLRELLAGREANGIFFSTMQKFEEGDGPLSERRNIVVMVDEAHRSQYGLEEHIDPRTGRVRTGAARLVRNALPNATYIGFTGTPIAQKDRSTREVFGDYIDVYDMTQAVEDGATRPVFYESRVVNLHLDEATLRRIDAEYDAMAEEAEEYAIEKSKRELGRIDSILGADATVASLCEDIVKHYEEFRQWEQTGKAMIVAYSRPIAMKIYHRILEMRPAWSEKLAVVMTSSNKDPEEWRAVIGNDAHKKELERRFKDNAGPLKIVIVVDMWLTGFDVPSLATMYVYKPMAGHNLMQAIARVNRVFGDKQGGLVVDYVGIASALKQAMNDYTLRDRRNYGDPDIAKTAYPEFRKKLEVCRDLLHGYDYAGFRGDSDLERARAISGGADFLQAPERAKVKEDYIREALLLRQALSLCQSMPDREERLGLFRGRAHLVDARRGQGQDLIPRDQRTHQRAAPAEHSERRSHQPLLGRAGGVFALRPEVPRGDRPHEGEESGRGAVAQVNCRAGAALPPDQHGAGRKVLGDPCPGDEQLPEGDADQRGGNRGAVEDGPRDHRRRKGGPGAAPHDRGAGLLRCTDQARGRAGLLHERPTAGHHTRTDRCPAQKQDNRLESEGERPGRDAPAGQTTAQEVQISARGAGGRTEHHHGAVRNVVGKQLSRTANRPAAVQIPYKFKRKPRCRHLQRGLCEV